MKRNLLLVFAVLGFLFLLSCDTAEDNNTAKISLTETKLGGCFGGSALRKAQVESDTVFFTKLTENELLMTIGLHYNCCAKLAEQFEFLNNEINVMIEDTSGRVCRCICYYQIDYKLKTESLGDIKYNVNLKEYHDSVFTNIYAGIYSSGN